MQFLLGLALTAGGFMMVWKTNFLVNNFGRVFFFEKYLGSSGGTRLGYKLIGIAVIFIGVLVMTGLIEGFMLWLLSPLTRHAETIQ